MTVSFTKDDINQDIISVTMLCASVIITFFGARFFKYIIFFFGFVVFALLTFILLPQIIVLFGINPSADTILYASLIVGAFCGVLLVVIFKVAVITIGAIFGVLLFQIIWIIFVGVAPLTIPEPAVIQAIGMVLFAIIGAYIALKLVKQVLKGITAFLGGFMFATSTAYFIQRLNTSADASDNVLDWVTFFATSSQAEDGFGCDGYCIGCIFIWLALFAAGVFVQYKCYKKKKNREYSESDDESSSSESTEDHSNNREKKKKKKRKKKKRQSWSSSGDAPYKNSVVASASKNYNPGYSGHHLDDKFQGTIYEEGNRNAAYPPSNLAMSAYGRDYNDPGANHGQTINYV